MTTYYGVWSDWSGRDGKEWWRNSSGELFRTTFLPVALAQAQVSNATWKRGPAYGTRKDERWEVRAIGEDGLPATRAGLLPPASERHECAMCGEPAKEWVDVHIKGWMCEQHSHVSVGCLSNKEEP